MADYLKTADSEWYKQRLFGVIVFALAAFVIIFIRLVYLQVIKGEDYRKLSLNNSIRLQSIDAPRGQMYDRHGNLLVDNRPSFDVSIVLKDARPLDRTLAKLAQYLNVPPRELMLKISRGRGISAYKPVLLKKDIGRNALAAIEVHKFDLPGVSVDVNLRRNYISKHSAAHLLGYLSEINPNELKSGNYPGSRGGDFIGKFGAEKVYENFLRGKRGGRQVEVNANGQVVTVLKTVAAEPGYNVYLTIDRDLQKKAEALLQGVAGAVVAMDPQTGRVLALASSPSFDQNAFAGGISRKKWHSLISNPLRPLSNKAIQGEYPPGSTFKIVTALAGLQEGVIDENTVLECPGFYRLGNRVYRCWKRGGHGRVDIIKALRESCDVFFYQVGQRLGIDRLAWYARACGLGAPTGINLGQEAGGLIPTAAWKKRYTGVAWQKGETLSAAIGQGFDLATPLQMADLISAVANGGIRYRPLILADIKTADGRVVHRGRSTVTGRLPVSEHTLALVRKGLWEVVNGEHGTARRVHIDGLDISGKTGTSQVIGRRADGQSHDEIKAAHLKAHAWFVAFAPSVDARIAVAVIVEHGEHGSSAAAPIAKELIRTYLHKMPPGAGIITRTGQQLSEGRG